MNRRADDDQATHELSEKLYTAISTLRRRVGRLSGDLWSPRSLTGAQLELLKLLRRQPMASVAEAAAELGLAPNTVSTLVRQLVDEGLLERARDNADRRVVRLHLTPGALQTMVEWNDQRTALTAQAISRLSRADRSTLARSVAVISELAQSLDRAEND